MTSFHAWLIAAVIICIPVTSGNHDAKRLYDDLLCKSGYNKLIRPAKNSSFILTVKLGLRLSQLIDVDEKNEILTTNMWVIQEWTDYSLRWNPQEYGGVTSLYVPSEKIWLPDIVLYNNADGDYTVTLMTKATLTYQGNVTWEPPVIFKSQCDMNVEFFPFDEQLCKLKLSAWTYDGFKIDLKHIATDKLNLEEKAVVEQGIDLKDFYRSVEWDLMAVPARKNIKNYPCCEEPYPDITFDMKIRRKTLYFTYNLIIPCVSINMLTLLTFYLPSDSGEKISLSISILLSLSLFQLLLMDLIPATSLTVPLIGRYILFTMVLVSLSVFISVLTLNVNFRSASTTELPEITKVIFLQVLPRLLFMKRPSVNANRNEADMEFPAESSTDLTWGNPYREKLRPDHESDVESLFGNYNVTSTFIGAQTSRFATANLNDFCYTCAKKKMNSYPPSAKKALEGCVFIAKHLKDEDDSNKVKDDWKYMALVIDRLFLWIYISVCFIGAMSILLNAPVLFDNQVPLTS